MHKHSAAAAAAGASTWHQHVGSTCRGHAGLLWRRAPTLQTTVWVQCPAYKRPMTGRKVSCCAAVGQGKALGHLSEALAADCTARNSPVQLLYAIPINRDSTCPVHDGITEMHAVSDTLTANGTSSAQTRHARGAIAASSPY